MAAQPPRQDRPEPAPATAAAKQSPAEVWAGLSRALFEGAVRAAELVLIIGSICLAVAALLTALTHRGYGAMSVLICVTTGSVMCFGGFMTRAGARPSRNRRRRDRQLERALEQSKDPMARARAEAEAKAPQAYISQGGITAAAGVAIIALGFIVDAILGTT